MNRRLGLDQGIVVANPIPAESSIPADEMAGYIATALCDADAEHIHGKAITPYMLDRIYRLSEGRSLTANVALVKNNAKVAAEIATDLCRDDGTNLPTSP